ncbi:2-oxoglutarate dehydrogenase E1 component [Roseateles violae]|uniref:oxoglutarate dehydrogenase (succinyl-transferring) n=1 Tax=Roseateles violae TaxID=3058042 RepID=A0ABT8DTP6_9BURK|nr:2-oxoglutarate dehydrogenase E1 component [Pelomonas sp. PFR6]MDN3921488.1 2-oxoglutarate dehydrogenase E1 component [Pelomonas sp. PFR6]
MLKPASPISSLNAAYLDSLEAAYRQDPAALPPDWRTLLAVLDDLGAGEALQGRLDAIRREGHLQAKLSPLDDGGGRRRILPGPAGTSEAAASPLADCYTTTLAVETAHIDDPRLRDWVCQALESGGAPLPAPERCRALDKLVEAEEFERFLSIKFPGKKRFGVEGCEVVVPMLDRLLRRAAERGVRSAHVGSMHRGRMNLMVNVLGKPLDELLREYKGQHPFADEAHLPADMPYHLGCRSVIESAAGGLALTLAPNPSHLEAVNAVVAGSARAQQDRSADDAATGLPITLHTDASVVGQGVVAELIQLSDVEGYSVGGTVHIVINNQLGFTTEPQHSRSSLYCTGPWKAVDSLILHVNADDVDACLRAVDLALEYRQVHGRDAVIDLVGYRRNGHNELDEPRFTQPALYAQIDAHPPVRARFARQLIGEGLVDEAQVDAARAACRSRLDAAYEAAQRDTPPRAACGGAPELQPNGPVGVDEESLLRIASELSEPPEGFDIHPNLLRQLTRQRETLAQGAPWALAEALAFATLLRAGLSVRLSGQDVLRGAFSHRHFAWYDQRSGQVYLPLSRQSRKGARFSVHNSPLSEYAVLGFEYGYSVESPNGLTIWEAQFGDFSNGAQIILDQFLAAGYEKWRQRSNLVVLLPHGLEGQGPEHSSARIERVLQLCANGNLRVVHPSTPANYFHLLRQQVLGAARQALIVFSPKTLLRLPQAVSALADFCGERGFEPVIASAPRGMVERVLLCSGKLAYELRAASDAAELPIAVVTLEQLYPLPAPQLRSLLARWPEAELVWVQEEPLNMGAWAHLERPLRELLEIAGLHRALRCVARPESASPAGSFHARHGEDQQQLLRRAMEFARRPADLAPSLAGAA